MNTPLFLLKANNVVFAEVMLDCHRFKPRCGRFFANFHLFKVNGLNGGGRLGANKGSINYEVCAKFQWPQHCLRIE